MIGINSWADVQEARAECVKFTYKDFVASLDKDSVFFMQPLFEQYKEFCREHEFLPGGRKWLFEVCRKAGIELNGDYKSGGMK